MLLYFTLFELVVLVGGWGVICCKNQIFNQKAHLIVNDCNDFSFFISFGILFKTIALEYDKLFLNNPILGFGIKKFPKVTGRRLDSV